MTLQIIEYPDSRYDTLKKGFNLRWPDAPSQACAQIAICETDQDVVQALGYALIEGMRPTIRSGGHCYEGLVSNNPKGLIIDVGLLQTMGKTVLPDIGAVYQLGPGIQMWDSYVGLYKRYGKTLPAGSCYSVGNGGHISGGGYGLLSRRNGLTVDCLSAVDIVIPDRSAVGGAALVHASDGSGNAYRDLFKACRGAGGGNFGIITNYYFSDLPDAPTEVVIGKLAFNWSDYSGADGREKFKDLLQTYGQYWVDHDADAQGWGLFALLQLTHSSALQFGLTLQFCDSNGTAQDLGIYEDFVNLFEAFEPTDLTTYIPPGTTPPRGRLVGQKTLPHLHGDHRTIDWLYATQTYNGSGDNRRGKYKSSYMKQNFTDEEAYAIYDALIAAAPPGADLSHSLVQVDSYGGRINRFPGQNNTSVAQRASVMKLQYQSYWTDLSADAAHLQWMSEFFAKVHDQTNCIPYDNGNTYEGCYINYPDVDMIDAAKMAGIDWRELYYPGMVPFLDQVKKNIDPDNVFRHALSIWPQTTNP